MGLSHQSYCDLFLDLAIRDCKREVQTLENFVMRELQKELLLNCEEDEEDARPAKRRKSGNRVRNRGYGINEIRHDSSRDFKAMFRMSRRAFINLLRLIGPKLSENYDDDPVIRASAAIRSCGSEIPAVTKLACTLRWLAGGSYLDIAHLFGVGLGSFYCNTQYGILWPTMQAIDESLQLLMDLDDVASLRQSANEFAVFSDGYMTDCVLAVDGLYVPTRAPTQEETPHVRSYYNRHGGYGLVVIGGCDARLRFKLFSAISSGGTNDIAAWQMTALCQALNNGHLPSPFYLVGDEAFTCTPQFLSPWPGRGIGTWRDSFNYHLSSMRQCIERAFGVLIRRFGILWRPLECAFDKWPFVLTVCAKLHNYCIDTDNDLNPPIGLHDADVRRGDGPAVFLNGNLDPIGMQRGAPIGTRSRNTRDQITSDLERRGRERPAFAASNSAAN